MFKRTLIILLITCIALVSSGCAVPELLSQESTESSNEEYNDNGLNQDDDDITPKYNIGDSVILGEYEQDNDLSNGKEPIEWTVIDRYGTDYLLISKYAIENKSYSTEGYADWRFCSLREWLNGEFYNISFNAEEKAQIVDNITVLCTDKVFCLTSAQVERYFPSSESRITSATPYAVAKGSYQENGACGWWLNGTGDDFSNAGRVNIKGNILLSGSSEGGAERTDYSVRPAIWIATGEVSSRDTVSFTEDNIDIEYVYASDSDDIIGIKLNGTYFASAGEHKYDKDGKLLSNTDCGLLYEEYIYDSNGYCIRIDSKWKYENTVYFYNILTNDSYGNILRDEEYDDNGKLSRVTVYEYDSNGNNTSSVHYDSDGNMTSKFTDTYNGSLRTEGCAYDDRNRLVSRTEYEYDGYGNITKSTHYDEDGSVSHTTTYENEYKNGVLVKTTSKDSRDIDPDNENLTYYVKDGQFVIFLFGSYVSITEYNDNGDIIRAYRNFGG